jgi:ketosteroid isomerase-like protein
MYYLTDDPSYVLIALGLAAACCLFALKITQQGKFLIWAGALVALAALVFGFERYWVTDAEQVEGVVYEIARAVQASDVDRIKSHLDDEVTIGKNDRVMDGSIPIKLALALLRQTHFEFVSVGQLTTEVRAQSRRGTAIFKVTASGTFNEGGSEVPMGSLGTQWELTFREASPGVWKVTRIQAISVPPQVSRALFGR